MLLVLCGGFLAQASRALLCSRFGLTPLSHIGKRCTTRIPYKLLDKGMVYHISCRCGTKVSSQNGCKVKPLAWGENLELPLSVLRTKPFRLDSISHTSFNINILLKLLFFSPKITYNNLSLWIYYWYYFFFLPKVTYNNLLFRTCYKSIENIIFFHISKCIFR